MCRGTFFVLQIFKRYIDKSKMEKTRIEEKQTDNRQSNSGISIFQKYLTVWVILCMIVGVLIGKFLPAIPAFLNKLSVAGISIPIAILIWIMIYPMMMKVDFQSVKQVATNDLIILVAFVPTVKFLLGVSNVSVPVQYVIPQCISFCCNSVGRRSVDEGWRDKEQWTGIF